MIVILLILLKMMTLHNFHSPYKDLEYKNSSIIRRNYISGEIICSKTEESSHNKVCRSRKKSGNRNIS